MTTPYPIRPPTATLYRVRTYASDLPLLTLWARGIGAALTRARFLAPRHEVVEVHGPGAVDVASWRDGVLDSGDPLASWPEYMMRDARATWPEATDEQLRSVLILTLLVLWVLNRQRALFKAIIIVNSILTFGLMMNLIALLDVLLHFSAKGVDSLLLDVVMMAVSNILLFSIWYWIIDPPGVEESAYENTPWDFLFPQRSGEIPHYESWLPRYTDYLYLAFTTSFAFSPTDVLPLTRRAKMLMLLQSTISIITLTAIAGGAINVLVGGS